jgi:hypothetical protein
MQLDQATEIDRAKREGLTTKEREENPTRWAKGMCQIAHASPDDA